MEHFIRTIKSYPCLWDTGLEDYKTIHAKEAAWRCVSKKCNISDVREAKHLWKKLRDSHRQAINKRKSSEGHSWKHLQQMEFLLPHIKKKRQSSSNECVIESFENTFQLSYSDDESKNSELSEPHTKKIKVKTHLPQVEENQETDILSEEILITEQENSSVKVFFDSMSEMCKTLPEYMQMGVQRAVFNIVMDAREENMRINKS